MGFVVFDRNRNVGTESRRSYAAKIDNGFWEKYIKGPYVLDIGFAGYENVNGPVLPIVDGAIGVDQDYPGYDGRILPFDTESQDAVYSSHALEHIPDYLCAIREWHRVTRIGGFIITIVPNKFLYERKHRPPSLWNADHRRFYSPASLLAEFEQALPPNSYRVRHLLEADEGYPYHLGPDQHPGGAAEIELVIEKIAPPPWRMLD